MKVAFLTLGCKVNFYETEKMMADFREAGFEVTDFDRTADLYIVNTCTVTNIADRKSRQMLHRAKKKNPDSLVVAVGCYAESGKEAVEKDSAVDLAFSNREKEGLARRILELLHVSEGGMPEPGPGGALAGSRPLRQERTRKYIKIQDGCNQFCSYCMIPYVRGGGVLKSRDEEEVLKEISRVAGEGYREVVITGIHLSSYGVDWSGEKQFVALKGKPLVELLKKINVIEGIQRIRLGSLEPRIICRGFLEGLREVDKLCPHFHLSLQSGCDATLKRMNRHYTAEEYREKCGLLRRYYEQPAITTDVIVGFPGETQEEFETTRAFVNGVGLSDIHVFKYSVRSGTRAEKMPGQVPPEEKQKRSEILLSDTARLRREFAAWFIGRREKVLFEEVCDREGTGYLVGHNERYLCLGIPLEEAQKRKLSENEMGDILVGEENLFL